MKFFNIDLHVSVIADLKNVFSAIGHEIEDWSLSGSTWVTGVEKKNIDIINEASWKSLNQNMANEFYSYYKDFLDQFDGFICTYPPAFAFLYEKTQKPIILVIPIRYEHPFTADVLRWNWLNNFLVSGIESNRLLIIANNKFDQEYFRAWIGKTPQYIPSLCEYTNTVWSPADSRFVVYSRGLTINHPLYVHKETLGRIAWRDLYSFSGIVHFPYACSTMSIFEQYTAGVPLYFPSKCFAKQLYFEMLDTPSLGLFFDLSFNRYYNLTASLVKPRFSSMDYNEYRNEEVVDTFISLSDFYDEDMMPAINYFNSIDELNYLTQNKIKKNVDNRKERKDFIYSQWQQVFQKNFNWKVSNEFA